MTSNNPVQTIAGDRFTLSRMPSGAVYIGEGARLDVARVAAEPARRIGEQWDFIARDFAAEHVDRIAAYLLSRIDYHTPI